MAAALPFFQIAGTVMSVFGALQQGSAASNAASYNARVAQQNAKIARDQASMQAQQADRENYLRLGSLRANAGASGGDVGQGSVLDVIGDVAAQGELEKQNILYRGELAARGYGNTAALDTYSSETSRTGGYLRAGSELLAGGVNYYTAREKLKRT